MYNSVDEIMIQPAAKRVKLDESSNEDRLSDLPEFVILHIMSFLNTEYVVRTCILSKKWKDLWKRLHALIMHSNEFRSLKIFNKFVSRVLSLRNSSIAPESLDFRHDGRIDRRLLKRIVNYVTSQNVQRLGLEVKCDIEQIRNSIFSCQTLTFLKLSTYPRGSFEDKTLFPNSISLPGLTTLHLEHFAFCGSDNNERAEPFSTFNRLNTLVLLQCGVRDTLTLCISSVTLVNFRHVDIDAEMVSMRMEIPQFLLYWLSKLSYTKSLTVTARTLQVLSFNGNLLKLKLPSLGNLKFLKVKKEPLPYVFRQLMLEAKLQQIKSRKEAAMLRKSFKAGLEPSAPIPDGIVEFLIQNSPSTEVDIVDC
ncbi:hypothetical protein TSUD_407910 [Trifolium subterraneum]|uniref:F-box domain-containing protein n=1 Tax=Trifolium subterraneum TaxID=3900 RepID=A0A2Z6P016_TRISU|nr:hypothetical protein TSUD_407910 [Trifolium subterraneum]